MSALMKSTPDATLTILRGVRAYSAIKKDAETMRHNWRLVGLALLEGRKLHASNQAFGKWCAEQGFDMAPYIRSDAMWLAENWGDLDGVQDDIAHPHHIRQAHQEAQQAPPPSDLASVTPTPTVDLDQRSAEKVVKVIQRARSGDEGADIAKRHVEGLAKKHGTTPEALYRIVRASLIEMYAADVLGNFRDELAEQLPEKVRKKLKDLPERGTLELSRVAESRFCFA